MGKKLCVICKGGKQMGNGEGQHFLTPVLRNASTSRCASNSELEEEGWWARQHQPKQSREPSRQYEPGMGGRKQEHLKFLEKRMEGDVSPVPGP